MYKILIIDDEEELLKNIKDFLETEGHTVFTSLNGNSGLELLKSQSPHLLLLDLHLKAGPTGLQVLRVAKMLKPNLKVIIFTGFGEEEEARDSCISLGADAFLSKPASLKNLTETIKGLLKEE